jgi:hypothetical protein
VDQSRTRNLAVFVPSSFNSQADIGAAQASYIAPAVPPTSFMRSQALSGRSNRHPAMMKRFVSDCSAELNEQSWASLGLIDVIVRGGTVELWGTLLDERKRSHRRSRKMRAKGCVTTLFTWSRSPAWQ